MLNFRNFQDLVRDTLKLAPVLRDVDAIVGVPRSGMLPATILATHLHKPLAIAGHLVPTGGQRIDHIPWAEQKWVIVDDSVFTGSAISAPICNDALKVCVYMQPGSENKVDHFAVSLPAPRLFEWNLFGSDLVKRSLFDIDGVLCPDPPMPEEDDGAYRDYLMSAPVLYKPLFPVAGLVTNRLEKYRGETQAWLAQQGIEYETLDMAPFDTPQARRRMSTPAALKAAWYVNHPVAGRESDEPGILIESHDAIASQVALAVEAPVISVQSMRCFQP